MTKRLEELINLTTEQTIQFKISNSLISQFISLTKDELRWYKKIIIILLGTIIILAGFDTAKFVGLI